MSETVEEQVRAALREVVDPELGIDVVDLGLVYGIEAKRGAIRVRMTMTSAACPLGAHLAHEAQAAIRRRLGQRTSVSVELVWEPPWSPDLMSEEARARLGGSGKS